MWEIAEDIHALNDQRGIRHFNSLTATKPRLQHGHTLMDDKEEKEIDDDNSKYVEVGEPGNEHKQSFAVLGKKYVKVADKEPQGDRACLREKCAVVALKAFDAVA